MKRNNELTPEAIRLISENRWQIGVAIRHYGLYLSNRGFADEAGETMKLADDLYDEFRLSERENT